MPEGAVSTLSSMQKCMLLSLEVSLQPSSVGTDALGREGAVGQGNQFSDAQDQDQGDRLLAWQAARLFGFNQAESAKRRASCEGRKMQVLKQQSCNMYLLAVAHANPVERSAAC